MTDCIVRIESLENGFEVEVLDPKIDAANNKPNSRWQDPYVSYAFNSSKDVCEFLEQVLDKLAPPSEAKTFADAFKKATSSTDD